MRTTLDIDGDVLSAAKEIARARGTSAGRVISDLARQALNAREPARVAEPRARHGFKPFGPRGGLVTNEIIDRLRDDDVY